MLPSSTFPVCYSLFSKRGDEVQCPDVTWFMFSSPFSRFLLRILVIVIFHCSLKICMRPFHSLLNPTQPCTETRLSPKSRSTFELFFRRESNRPPNVTQWIDQRKDHPSSYSLSINARRTFWFSDRLHPPLVLPSSTFLVCYSLWILPVSDF